MIKKTCAGNDFIENIEGKNIATGDGSDYVENFGDSNSVAAGEDYIFIAGNANTVNAGKDDDIIDKDGTGETEIEWTRGFD
ncbi:MAG: hypothetical protein IJG80_05535 [Selenomonadaceae bacterium]|nr:hypothetical protein [Selenomonadaceae bacterium]MBQ3727443.1 hypothetical protein [Selenomonadaceae bacterium]MBQ9497648.1 hypothetical protein [Selenomonadaceae bacterium]